MVRQFPSLKTTAQRLQPHLANLRVAATRGWAWTKRWSAATWALTKVVARKTYAFGKRALIATLTATENVLLSPSGRERVHATAVFTLIFAFGVTSVDYLLTGGPELVPSSARAAPYVAQASLISTRTPRPVSELAFADPIETTVRDGVIEDATVTPLSARAPAPPNATPVESPKPEPATSTDAEAGQRTKVKDNA